MLVQWLSSERNHVLLIEGHVDIELATQEFVKEGGDEFPPARHSFMRFTDVPEGEEGSWWREECAADARGAEPVTVSAIQY